MASLVMEMTPSNFSNLLSSLSITDHPHEISNMSWGSDIEARFGKLLDSFNSQPTDEAPAVPYCPPPLLKATPCFPAFVPPPIVAYPNIALERLNEVAPEPAPKAPFPASHMNSNPSPQRVLQILRQSKEEQWQHSAGWEALQQVWGISPKDFDDAVLTSLNKRLPQQQERMLLSFAAIDLSNVCNLSAYLNSLIKEHETSNQVCLYFLAGVCDEETCGYVHPVETPGWNALREQWSLSFRDLDYTVLNYLCKKSDIEQTEILQTLASMNLAAVHNLSAYLSSIIQKYEQNQGRMKKRKGGAQKIDPNRTSPKTSPRDRRVSPRSNNPSPKTSPRLGHPPVVDASQ